MVHDASKVIFDRLFSLKREIDSCDCSNFNIMKRPDIPANDLNSGKYFYHDFSDETIKIYHCTVSNNNPVT